MHALAGTGVTMSQESLSARDADFSSYMHARQASLLRTAYLLTGDRHTAEDLVQTAFAKLYLSWDKVQSRDSIDGYVRRILVNENNSLWRRAWKRREHTTDELPEGATSTATTAAPDASCGTWCRPCPRKARAVVVLRYYEELSEAETAEVLGISVGTVKSQTSRALAALRERAPEHPRPPHPGRRSDERPADHAPEPAQLHDQVDDLHGAPLTLETVRGRARAIRRTRRMLVAGAAAVAVAAVVVPITLLGDTRTQRRGPQRRTPRAGRTDPAGRRDVPAHPRRAGGAGAGDRLPPADSVVPRTGSTTSPELHAAHAVRRRLGRHPLLQAVADAVGVVGARRGPRGGLGGPRRTRPGGQQRGTTSRWIDVTGGGDAGTLVRPRRRHPPSYAPSRPIPRSRVSSATTGGGVDFDGTTGETSYTRSRPTKGWPRGPGRRPIAGGLPERRRGVRRRRPGGGAERSTRRQHVLGGAPDRRSTRVGGLRDLRPPAGRLQPGRSAADRLRVVLRPGIADPAILDAATGEPVVEWTSSRQRRSGHRARGGLGGRRHVGGGRRAGRRAGCCGSRSTAR